jgi:hypothetical protein
VSSTVKYTEIVHELIYYSICWAIHSYNVAQGRADASFIHRHQFAEKEVNGKKFTNQKHVSRECNWFQNVSV